MRSNWTYFTRTILMQLMSQFTMQRLSRFVRICYVITCPNWLNLLIWGHFFSFPRCWCWCSPFADSNIPFLFFSTKTEVRKVDLRHGFNYSVVISGLQTTIGLDFHWAEQQLYYSDGSTDKIRRCFLDGSKCEDVITTGLLMTEGKFCQNFASSIPHSHQLNMFN